MASSGGHDTAQRRAIRQVLITAGRPLTPLELHQAAKVELPRLGVATVYRTLRLMQDAAEVVAVELPGLAPRYEVAGKGHHHHFHCRGCGGVFEIDACPGNLGHLVPKGFVLDGHEISLFGRCPACAATTPAEPPPATHDHAGHDHGPPRKRR